MTQGLPPDDGPPPTDDDAPDAPPKAKRKRKPPALRLVNAPQVGGPDDWRLSLRTKSDGSVSTKEVGNAALFLAHHDEWKGCLAYDEFSNQIVWRRLPPALPGLVPPSGKLWDAHVVYVQQWLAKCLGLTFTVETLHKAIEAAAHANKFHPVRDYLEALRWDGTVRLPRLMSQYFGAKHSPYLEQVGVAWMISAIARIMNPGCKVDHMLVLCGAQGTRKSSGLAELFGADWFSDSPLDIGSAEAYKKLQGKWGIEIPELDAFRGRASSQIKAFLTAPVDRFRESYARHPKDFPRTCIFAGTTNEKEFLGDRTGNRRFWPVECGKIDRPAIQSGRDQLWAEALVRYQSGEKWWLEDETLAREQQRLREFREPWFDLVSKWLEHPIVPIESNNYRLIDLDDGFTQADVFRGALSLQPKDMNRDAQTRLGFVIAKLGFERRRRRAGNTREYAYFRCGPTENASEDGEKP